MGEEMGLRVSSRRVMGAVAVPERVTFSAVPYTPSATMMRSPGWALATAEARAAELDTDSVRGVVAARLGQASAAGTPTAVSRPDSRRALRRQGRSIVSP